MDKVAIIGAGISGLVTGQLLNDRYYVKVFESEAVPGGLIRCKIVDGNLFHICGGHVFNSKRQDVLDWFWRHFVKENEFLKIDRNAVVLMDDGKWIPYPIENHVYLLDDEDRMHFYEDLEEIDCQKGLNVSLKDYENFGDFLRWRFGKTLYKLYFKPYNEKIWGCNLNSVPITWMEGKLPMPTTNEMHINNMNRIKEKTFVHSSFWYEIVGGSQFIANRLSEGLDIQYNVNIDNLQYVDGKWNVCGDIFDIVVFCGNIKDMVKIINGVDVEPYMKTVDSLGSHGTTSVFCEIDKNPYSWIYLPSPKYDCHRIICTGNFSQTNNSYQVLQSGRITATIEFTDYKNKEDIIKDLSKLPLHPTYIAHQYNKYTYPIQDTGTRAMIKALKKTLAPKGFYFTGRFADWEYYNMDVAIGAAIDLCKYL